MFIYITIPLGNHFYNHGYIYIYISPWFHGYTSDFHGYAYDFPRQVPKKPMISKLAKGNGRFVESHGNPTQRRRVKARAAPSTR